MYYSGTVSAYYAMAKSMHVDCCWSCCGDAHTIQLPSQQTLQNYSKANDITWEPSIHSRHLQCIRCDTRRTGSKCWENEQTGRHWTLTLYHMHGTHKRSEFGSHPIRNTYGICYDLLIQQIYTQRRIHQHEFSSIFGQRENSLPWYVSIVWLIVSLFRNLTTIKSIENEIFANLIFFIRIYSIHFLASRICCEISCFSFFSVFVLPIPFRSKLIPYRVNCYHKKKI